MSTAASTAEFHVRVDAKQAQRELDATRASAFAMGGALEKIDRASTVAAKGVGALTPALGSLSRSSSEVLRGMGDLAGMIGPGGGLAIGLTVAVSGAVKLYEAWKEYAENGRVAQQATDAIIPALNRLTDNALKPAEEAIKRMSKELAELDTTLGQRDREAAGSTVDQLQRQRDNLDAARRRVDPTGRIGRQAAVGIGVDSQEAQILARIGERATKLDEALGRARRSYDALVTVEMRLDKAKAEQEERERVARGGAGRARGASAGSTSGSSDRPDLVGVDEMLNAEREAREWRAEAAEAQWQEGLKEAQRIQKQQEDHQAYLVRLHGDAQAEMLRQAEETAAKKSALMDKEKAEQIAFAEGVGAGVGSALVQISNASIALATADAQSRKQLFVQILGAEAQRAGGMVTLKGAELVAQGVATGVGSAGALAPLAAAQVGAGLALMGAGAAITVGGPKAVGALVGAIPAGVFGDAGGGGRARDPGVNTRARRSSGRGQAEGGGLTQVFNYGVAGPTAEDQSREIVRRLRTGADMRFT